MSTILSPGKRQVLTAKFFNGDGVQVGVPGPVAWSSSNEAIVSLAGDDGHGGIWATAEAAGTATVTARCGDIVSPEFLVVVSDATRIEIVAGEIADAI